MLKALSTFLNRGRFAKHGPVPMRGNPAYSMYDVGVGSYGTPSVRSWLKDARLAVGAYCSFAEGVIIILGGEHRMDWVTTYPFPLMLATAAHFAGFVRGKGDVRIGSDVWIGTGATILSGVTIGDGAVIGAQSVVTKNVEPYAIVAGNPARLLRYRFDPETISELQRIQWWTWSPAHIEQAMPLLLSSDVNGFIRAYGSASVRCGSVCA